LEKTRDNRERPLAIRFTFSHPAAGNLPSLPLGVRNEHCSIGSSAAERERSPRRAANFVDGDENERYRGRAIEGDRTPVWPCRLRKAATRIPGTPERSQPARCERDRNTRITQPVRAIIRQAPVRLITSSAAEAAHD